MENLLISEFISKVATLPTCLLSRRDRGWGGVPFLAAWSDVFLKNGYLVGFYIWCFFASIYSIKLEK